MADELNSLPDVPGLEQIAQEVMQEKDRKFEQVVEPKGEPFDLAQFKNPRDMLKSYKEIQGAFTKMTEENKSLSTKITEYEKTLQQMRDEIEIYKVKTEFSPPASIGEPPDVSPQLREYLGDEGMSALERLIERKTVNQLTTLRIVDVLNEEEGRDREDFQERLAYMYQVANQYPQLKATPEGVRKLFQLGDKLREERTKRLTDKAIKAVLGDDVDIERMKQTFKRSGASTVQTSTNLAYMPETTGSVRTGAEAETGKDYEDRVHEAAKTGDVDSVLNLLFKQKLGT